MEKKTGAKIGTIKRRRGYKKIKSAISTINLPQNKEMLKEQELAAVGSREKPQGYPILYVDEAGKRVRINNGKIISFLEGGYHWEVLLLLASRPQTDIPYNEIKDFERKFGSKTKTTSIQSIAYLRETIGENPKDPKIIITSGTLSWERKTAYRLEADVKFIEESDPDRKTIFPEPEQEKPSLDENQLKAAYALFAINEDNTNFKYVSRADLIRRVFFENSDPKTAIIFRTHVSAFQAIRKKIISVLEGSKSIPLDEMQPETAAFISWLKEQPVYANLSIEDLVLVVERKIQFEKLKKINFA